MLAVVFLAAYGVARGTAGLMLAGLALLAAGFYLGYRLEISTTLAGRVRMWQSPWDNAARGGDQIAQALWSLSTGGWLGTGPGLGDTRYLPAGHTDLVLAAIGEELGFAGLVIVGLVYAALVWRSLQTARKASTDYAFFLAIVLTLFLAVPVLLVTSGMLGLVPLTGVVTPFLSFGGSAMAANFAVLGLLAAIRSDTGPAEDLQVFRNPMRWVGATLACAGTILVAAAAAGADGPGRRTGRGPTSACRPTASAGSSKPARARRRPRDPRGRSSIARGSRWRPTIGMS